MLAFTAFADEFIVSISNTTVMKYSYPTNMLPYIQLTDKQAFELSNSKLTTACEREYVATNGPPDFLNDVYVVITSSIAKLLFIQQTGKVCN